MGIKTVLLGRGRSTRWFGFERDGHIFGTAIVKRVAFGWTQARRDPFEPADRFLVADLTGDIVFTLNRAV